MLTTSRRCLGKKKKRSLRAPGSRGNKEVVKKSNSVFVISIHTGTWLGLGWGWRNSYSGGKCLCWNTSWHARINDKRSTEKIQDILLTCGSQNNSRFLNALVSKITELITRIWNSSSHSYHCWETTIICIFKKQDKIIAGWAQQLPNSQIKKKMVRKIM